MRIRSRRGSGFWSHKHRSHNCVPIAMPEEAAEAITRSAKPKTRAMARLSNVQRRDAVNLVAEDR